VSQSRILLSSLPDARMRLSGDHVKAFMPAKCPSRLCSRVPVVEFQSFIVQSEEPEAM
jgi:hypothetical protein